jgi:hypothetical protein
MKKYNIALLTISVLTAIVIGILYHCNLVGDFNKVIIIIAAVLGLITLSINCMRNWFKSILFAFAICFIVIGIGKLTVITGYVGTYAYTSINNVAQINKIVKNESTIHLFSYDGYDYYTDSAYSQMYKVKQNGLFSTIEANTILIEKDAYETLTDHFGIFYEVNNNTYFSNIEDNKISISAPIGKKDEIIFVKIINKDKKVFYTYINPDDPSRLFQEMGIVSKMYDIGSTTLLVMKPTKVIDGTITGEDGVASSETQQYFISITDQKLIASYATEVKFDGAASYHTRINYYLYKEAFLDIEIYEEAIKSLEKDSDEYKKAEEQLKLLKEQIVSHTCELCYEDVHQDYELRLYRVFLPSGALTETPDITIVEIKYGELYWYGETNLTLEELK